MKIVLSLTVVATAALGSTTRVIHSVGRKEVVCRQKKVNNDPVKVIAAIMRVVDILRFDLKSMVGSNEGR